MMACLKGFEPPTNGLEGRCSILLSYRHRQTCSVERIHNHARFLIGAGDGNRTHATSLEGWDSTIELHPHFNSFFIITYNAKTVNDLTPIFTTKLNNIYSRFSLNSFINKFCVAEKLIICTISYPSSSVSPVPSYSPGL